MSRLESFIRRLTAQRDLLDRICVEVAAIPGPIMELGLGNGRTFDHISERLPGRRIIAFDRAIGAHAGCMPPGEDLILGDIRETAARFAGIDAALVHADIGTGYDDKDAVTLTWLPDLAASLAKSGGIVASGLPLEHPELTALPLPPSVPKGRYYVYRRN